MITCVCNNISDTTFKKIIQENNVTTIKQIKKCGVDFQCCKCVPEVKRLIKESNEQN